MQNPIIEKEIKLVEKVLIKHFLSTYKVISLVYEKLLAQKLKQYSHGYGYSNYVQDIMTGMIKCYYRNSSSNDHPEKKKNSNDDIVEILNEIVITTCAQTCLKLKSNGVRDFWPNNIGMWEEITKNFHCKPNYHGPSKG